MGPSNRKRKEPPLKSTLLDFFSSPHAIKPARVRTSPQLTPGVRPGKVASRETIVIDSDSDEALHGKGNGIKRTRLAPSRRESRSPNLADKDLFGVPSALLRTPNPCVKPSSNGFHTHLKSPTFPPKAGYSESMFALSACKLLEQTSISS